MAFKILIIRFSSFGDIVQMLSVPTALKNKFQDAEIHWVTRRDFEEIANTTPNIYKIWSLDRKQGLWGLIKIIFKLREEKFSHIYDAHNNVRSHIICWGLRGFFGISSIFSNQKFLRRSRYRWRRFLLFRFHINKYPKPFVGQWALLESLQKWGVSLDLPSPPQMIMPKEIISQAKAQISRAFKDSSMPVIALSPSASYTLKRWPVACWKKLILDNPQWSFVLLGGPQDGFIQDIANVAPHRTINFAGKLTYMESAGIIFNCHVLVSNDTGLMHVAEQIGKPCVALMGPAPFGYPGRSSTKVLERELPCRPCSKHGQGPCTNKEYQKCLVDISVEEVSAQVKQWQQYL